jgi:hypothetical protein
MMFVLHLSISVGINLMETNEARHDAEFVYRLSDEVANLVV